MKLILSLTSKGAHVTAELQPEWAVVGYGHVSRTDPVHAVVALGYDHIQQPLVKLVTKTMRVQQRSPVIAIYDNTVQVTFSASPISPECQEFIRKYSELTEVADDIAGLHIVSTADMFPQDEEYKIFQKCYARDHTIALVLMEVANVGPQGGDGQPFEVISVNDLKNEFQKFPWI